MENQSNFLHVKNIYEDGELKKVSREVKRKAKHYNLEMILAVGYRVRSHRGTQFRQWATERLNEYYERLGSEVRCFSRI